MIVGTAEVLILANTAGFRKELEASTSPAFAGLRNDAEVAGADAGAGLRSGVKGEAGKLESDLGDIGSAGGLSLRKGVTGESGKLVDDLEKDGARAGEGFHSGISSGLSKLATLISNTGLPLGGLSSGLEKSAGAAEHLDSRSSGLMGTLDKLGGVALAGVAAASVGVAAGALDVGEKMQGAEASIASASGTSIKAAAQIGTAFEGTAFKSEFSAITMANAYAQVAGQLKQVEGHALSGGEAMKVMSAADDLATAKQIDLGSATGSVVGIMQAFQLKAGDASHVSDVLYKTSVATGQGVDTLASQIERLRGRLGAASGSLGELTGLMVDMTDRGITGRAALGAVNTAMNTLITSGTGVQKALALQNASLAQMPPTLRSLAEEYLHGSITAKELTSATKGLPGQQAQLVSSFTTANKAVETAQLKYKALGVEVFDQQGRFVGMRDIIDQLHTRMAGMTEQQQLATASMLFGSGAARQMLAVIQAGPAAYEKATASVNQQGAAHEAAAKQAATLHVEVKTLEAGLIDLAGRIGSVLIPIVTAMVGWFTKATSYVLDHKVALIALAGVVTAVLGPAIAVFAINKMATFASSFVTASGHVKQFASDVESVVSRVTSAFGKQTSAATTAADNLGAQTTKMSGEASAAASTIEGENTAAGTSFAKVTAGAVAEEAPLAAAEAGLTGEVATADTAIEGDNTAAGLSFARVLGPLGIIAGGVIGYNALTSALGASKHAPLLHNQATGQNYVNPRAAELSGTGGLRFPPQALPVPGLGGSPVGPIYLGSSGRHHAANPRLSRIHTAGDVGASMASVGGGSYLDQVAQFLGGAGFNKTAIAGIYGNALQESSDNPNTPGGGMWQQISNFGQGTGGSLQNQMRTMLPQILGLKGALNNAGSAANAASIFMNDFEKPRVSTENLPRRVQGANTAYAELGGMGGAPSISTTGVSDALASSSATAAQQLAAAKAQLAKTVAEETAQLNEKIASEKASVAGKGVSSAEKQRVAQEIADQKAALQIEIAQQKAALGELTASQKVELKQQTTDAKAGSSQLTKMLAAIHTGSVKSLQTALTNAHTAGLSRIEHDLDRDHNTALTELSRELVQVHKEALAELVKAEAAAATAAYDKSQTTLLGKEATDLKDTAQRQADLIADNAKIAIDQAAQTGKTGLDLAAAQAQVGYDTVKAQMDQAIDGAQQKLDDDTAAGGSALQLAQDQYALAQQNAKATINEAQSQAALDKANAAAQNAATAAGLGVGSPTSPTGGSVNLYVTGGPYSPSEIAHEISWALTIGALPVAPAPPPAVPA